MYQLSDLPIDRLTDYEMRDEIATLSSKARNDGEMDSRVYGKDKRGSGNGKRNRNV